MSLDSRRTGFPRLNATNNSVYTIRANVGLLPPDQLQGNDPDSSSQHQQQQDVEITYTDLKTIGNGSFGIVFQATLQKPTQEQIAIKKVLQDKRFKNRELQIMRRLDHCNVVKLKYFFHVVGERGGSEVYLNLVLEYIPETLYKIARTHSRTRQNLPMILVKLYMYQLFRSLNYIHSMQICHRDIKPQNLLLNPETGVLKLCDFGSAKSLVAGEPNVAYICSRYYRAPELIFGATDYTTKIDIWSAGCVMAELILGEPMFPGESGVDQLVEIIKVLGTPTREQMRAMNPNYVEFRFPAIKSRSWTRVFPRAPSEAARLVSHLLEYTPSNRSTPLEACAHPFFDDLRSSSTNRLPNGREFPPLFNFSEEELSQEPQLASKLIPRQNSNQSPQDQRQEPQQQHQQTKSQSSQSQTPTQSQPPPPIQPQQQLEQKPEEDRQHQQPSQPPPPPSSSSQTQPPQQRPQLSPKGTTSNNATNTTSTATTPPSSSSSSTSNMGAGTTNRQISPK